MRRGLVVAALVSCVGAPAHAHRLDQYLQQTLIQLEPRRIVLHVGLTPGVAVAASVVATIDRDGDAALSDDEKAAYADRVRRDLALRCDGRPLPLRVVSAEYPTIASMIDGGGTIALTLEASLLAGLASGTLSLTNQHDAASSAYLVNALRPSATAIRLGTQTRSPDQSHYEVQLTIDREPQGPLATPARPSREQQRTNIPLAPLH